jgi:hypothetical protein
LFRQAAKIKQAAGQYNPGCMLEMGSGVVKDVKKAIKLYRGATKQGLTQAQLYLGNIYYNGELVTQDYGEALKWFHLAAQQGEFISQLHAWLCLAGVKALSKTRPWPKNGIAWPPKTTLLPPRNVIPKLVFFLDKLKNPDGQLFIFYGPRGDNLKLGYFSAWFFFRGLVFFLRRNFFSQVFFSPWFFFFLSLRSLSGLYAPFSDLMLLNAT